MLVLSTTQISLSLSVDFETDSSRIQTTKIVHQLACEDLHTRMGCFRMKLGIQIQRDAPKYSTNLRQWDIPCIIDIQVSELRSRIPVELYLSLCCRIAGFSVEFELFRGKKMIV